MDYQQLIVRSREELDRLQALLDLNGPAPDAGRDETLHCETFYFANDIEVDIKIVNSNSGPYIDAILFESGCEVVVLEPSYTIEGTFYFNVDENNYWCDIAAEVDDGVS